MNDLMTMLKSLHRPRLLVRAARFGLADYSRERDLRRIMKESGLPSPGRALMSLMSEERHLEDKRKTGDAAYSIARHVEILIALMAEARLLRAVK